MDRFSLNLLGTFQVTINGEPITRFEYDKVRALLAYLAVESGRPHRRDELTGLFWPEQTDAVARKSLNQALYTLRRTMGDKKGDANPFILADRTAVQINPAADVWLDVWAFEAGVTAVASQSDDDWETAVLTPLKEAATLYQGDFLKGLTLSDSPDFDDWLAMTRERLHRQAIELLDRLTQVETRRGEWQPALHYARRQVALEPWREEAHRQMMLLLARTGDTNAAIAQYEICQEVLTAELGIAPMPETTHLHQRIVAVRNGEYPHNLPHQQTKLIGREAELRQLKHLLAHPRKRLITLVGPGGIGKTQLAIAAAHQNRHLYLEGVTFVPLAPLSEPEQIITSIASSLNFPLQADARRSPAQQLLDYLHRKEMLLVLDNFEHLLAGTEFLAEILSTAPDIQLVVTSRERLHHQTEQLFPIMGLDYPKSANESGFFSATPEPKNSEPTYASGWLFLRAARRQQPGFSLKSADEYQNLVALTGLVAGMPLALELAASWIDMLSLPDILAEVQKSFDFLESEQRDVPERHRSIRAAIDTSWQLLNEQEQAIFAQLSVFRGGFTREAAKAVTGVSLRRLSRLNSKSLLQYDKDEERYQIHDLLRQYGAERLGQDVEVETAVLDRHAAYFLEWFRTPCEPGSIKLLFEMREKEVDNLRVMMRRGLTSRDLAVLVEIVCMMYRLWEAHGYAAEIGGWLEGILANDKNVAKLSPELYALALRIAGNFIELLDLEIQKAYHYCEKSLLVAQAQQDHLLIADALSSLANKDGRTGNYALARTRNEEALTLYKKHGLLNEVRRVQSNLAEQLSEEGAFEVAWAYAEKALKLAKELESEGQMAVVLDVMGMIAMRQEKFEAARAYFERALAIWDEQQNNFWRSVVLEHLGALALKENKLNAAERILMEALHAFAKQNVRDQVPTTLNWVAGLRLAQGKAIDAVHIYAAVDTFYNQFGLVRPPVEIPEYEQALTSTREKLGDEVFEAAWKQGESLELFELARELVAEQSETEWSMYLVAL